MRPIERLSQSLYISAPEISQLAALAALGARDELDVHREAYRRNRDLLARELSERLPDTRCIAPQGTYLAWIDCRALPLPEGVAPARFFLRQAQVALTDGRDCGEAGAGFVRFNFAMPRPLLDEALSRMGEALRRQAR